MNKSLMHLQCSFRWQCQCAWQIFSMQQAETRKTWDVPLCTFINLVFKILGNQLSDVSKFAPLTRFWLSLMVIVSLIMLRKNKHTHSHTHTHTHTDQGSLLMRPREIADTRQGTQYYFSRWTTAQITFLCYCILTLSLVIFTGQCCESRFFFNAHCIQFCLLFEQH